MPITEQQRAERRSVIGSSDMAAILGLDPWRSPLHVYLSKVHETTEIEGNDAIELGNAFEAPLLHLLARDLGVEIIENVRTSIDGLPFASNHDALIVDRPEGMEAKVRTYDPAEFGQEDDSDIVPPRILVQCMQQMWTGNLERVRVPVLMPEYGRLRRRRYKVERSEAIIDLIRERGLQFWNEHVIPRIPPPASFGELEILKRIKRVSSKVIEVDAALVAEWELAKKAETEAKKLKERLLVDILVHVGDGDGWTWGEEGVHYSYHEYEREGLDTDSLWRDHPEIWEAYGKKSTYRAAFRRSEKSKKKGRRDG